jgi:hypothetical protein
VSFPFDPLGRLVLVKAEVEGLNTQQVDLELALDTGATRTVIQADVLQNLGYDLSQAPLEESVTSSGTVWAPAVRVNRIAALGRARSSFELLGHTFPPEADVNGLLGWTSFAGSC